MAEKYHKTMIKAEYHNSFLRTAICPECGKSFQTYHKNASIPVCSEKCADRSINRFLQEGF